MWMTWILTNWRTCLLGVGIILVTLLFMRCEALSARLDAKTQEIQSIKREAENYRINSEKIAKETSDAYKALVESTEKNAWKNAKARFSNAACAPAIGVLPTEYRVSQADSTQGTDGVPESESVVVGRPFIEACASDAGQVMLWQTWAKSNGL